MIQEQKLCLLPHDPSWFSDLLNFQIISVRDYLESLLPWLLTSRVGFRLLSERSGFIARKLKVCKTSKAYKMTDVYTD